jgi:SAM-dependent methyltransferase
MAETMSTTYRPHAALIFHKGGIHALDWRTRTLGSSLKTCESVVLESFAHHASCADAYNAYCSLDEECQEETVAAAPLQLDRIPTNRATALLMVKGSVLVCAPALLPLAYRIATEPRMAAFHNEEIQVINDLRLGVPLAARTLAHHYAKKTPDHPKLTFAEFSQSALTLFSRELLMLPFGKCSFGDLRRSLPICSSFGLSRGTPIDRYYLDQFVLEIRDEVRGETLEIGGVRENREAYGFTSASSYKVMDLDPSAEPDVVADAHRPDAHQATSLDSVVIFNVLEHCERPWIVVENIHAWLRPGGKVFCMVPNSQRVHPHPKDYWRVLPDALHSQFAGFRITKLRVYGNLLASVASLAGVAAEELDAEELIYFDPSYPVATCAVATK